MGYIWDQNAHDGARQQDGVFVPKSGRPTVAQLLSAGGGPGSWMSNSYEVDAFGSNVA